MRDFTRAKRIVLKIGTNTLTRGGRVDTAYFNRITRQVSELLEDGRQVVIVTSGAIGMGSDRLGAGSKVADIKMRQACAAVGQPLLMRQWRRSFARHGVETAQVLVTADVLNNRKTYLNLRNAVETLLGLSVVPVLNENDSVSTDEIGSAFGDNDTLSALVASKLDADLLIMLSDIDGLYDKDPRRFPDAALVDTVYEITERILRAAAGPGSRYGTGGMRTKLQAALIASGAGCSVVLAGGRQRSVISRIMSGSAVGTVFAAKRRLGNRARWILNSAAAGTVTIDEGAMRAVRNKKSLLPSGVTAVRGNFEAGSVVMLNDAARAVVSLGSSELKALAGKHSSQIRRMLGPGRRDVVAIPEDIVFL
jgi:glutamate 5-kinase